MTSDSNLRKEKIEIKIDSEEAIDNFGSETFEENILLFVDEGYNNYKNGIKKAKEERDLASMKILTHTLKTTSRYMSSENFAQMCQGIESETKSPNWDKIDELLTDFFYYLDLLYNECIKYYNDFKPEGEVKTLIPIENDESGNDKKNLKNNIIGNNKNENDFHASKFQAAAKFESNISISSPEKIHKNNLTNGKSAFGNNNQNNFRHSSFKNCKTFIAGEKPFLNNISNLIENDTNDFDNSISDLSLNLNAKQFKREESDNISITGKGADYLVRNHTNSSNNMGSFSNSFLDQRNSFLGQNRIDSSGDDNLGKSNSANKNNCLEPRSKNNLLQSTKTIATPSRTFLNPNTESSSIEIYSPIPDGSNKVNKYSKILNDASIVCKELNLNGKNIKGAGYNSSISSPKFMSGNYEITTSKTELNEGSMLKKKMETPTSKGSNSNLNSSFKNCIKSLRDIDKPTSNGSYFKLKLDEKPKAAFTNQEFKKIFTIDIQKVKIGKCESKEKLRNFSEDEIFKLMTRLRKIVDAENLDKKDLVNCLKELRLQLKIINFSYICERIDSWLEQLDDITSLVKYKLSWIEFEALFIKIDNEVNLLLENLGEENNQSSASTNNNKKTNPEKEPNFYDQQLLMSSENLKDLLKSPIMLTKSLVNNNFCNVKEFHNSTLRELKPIMIENIFRNGKSPGEIKNGIKKLLEDCTENAKPIEHKPNSKFNRQNINNNQNAKQDFSYPFKQDTFSCKIF